MLRVARTLFAVCAFLATAVSAFGQSSIINSGAVTPGHPPMYVQGGFGSQAVATDSGPAGGGGVGLGLSELLAVARGTGVAPYAAQGSGPFGTNICDYDAPITNATGYHYLCFSANAQGGALIATGAGGSASPQPFCFIVNGAPICIGGSSGTNVVTYTPPTTVGVFPCWASTGGLLGDCTVGAATLVGNPAASPAKANSFTLASLPARGAPDANNDKILILNNSTGLFNYVTPGLIASAATAGVSSLGGVTGPISVGAGLSISGSTLSGSGVTSIASQNGAISLGSGLSMTGSTLDSVAGGTNGQIQVNSSGHFAGESKVTLAQGGNNVDNSAASSNDILSYNGTGFIHSALVSVINAVCGLAPGTCTSVFGYVYPSWYGVVCDGSTNATSAFQTMVNASVGKTIFLAPSSGPCVIGTTVTLAALTTIIGPGWGAPAIKSTVVNAPTFAATDVSDVVLSNFWIEGTNAANSWTSGNIGAFSYAMDASATGSLANVQFTHMKLTSFNATYWTSINLTNSTDLLFNVHYDDNLIITDASSPPTSPVNGENNWAFVFFSGTAGGMRNSTFSRNNISGTGVCFGLLFFGAIEFVNIDQNNIQNVGQTATSHCNNADGSTVNSYGIAAYDLYSNGNYPQHYTINGNVISSPYGAGVYLVGGSSTAQADAVIANNNISGQTSTDNVQIPRAGVVDNGMGNVIIANNSLDDNWGGIDVAGIFSGQVEVSGNQCYTGNGDSNSHCYRIDGGGIVTSTASTINLAHNRADMNTTGPALTIVGSTSGVPLGSIFITDNTFRANTSGILGSNQFFAGSFVLSGNLFTGTMSSVMAQLRGNTGLMTLSGNVFDSSGGVAGNGLDIGGSNVAMTGNVFENRASGSVAMYAAVPACGTISGTTFTNVIQTAQVAATSFGTSNPSGCTLTYGDFVQNLTPTGTSSIIWGWEHTSTTASTTHQALTFP